jgi:hypothetical protein
MASASINPRTDGIVVGNMQERGNWSLEPNDQVRRQNVDAAIQFFGAMRAAPADVRLTQSGPPRDVPTLESFYGAES